MKRFKIFVLAAVLMILAGCRDVVNSVLDALPPFEVPFSTQMEVPFAAVSTTSYTRTPEIPMNINLDAEIRANNPRFSINNLKSVKLERLSFEYVSSSLGNKLDVIKDARIYVKAPDKPELLIATVTGNSNPDMINFSVKDVELLEYFRTADNSLIIEILASRATADKIKMKLNSGFKIKVQL